MKRTCCLTKSKRLLRIGISMTCAVILLSFPSCKPSQRNPRTVLDRDYKDQILKGRETLKVLLLTSSAPGLSVSVSIDGKTVWSQGMGYANKELKVPASPETKFRIGRTSQMFTTFLVGRLQDEGKLKVTDSFYKYIPDFPKKQWDFTPLQLGVTSAGFPEDKVSELVKKNKDKNNSLKDYLQDEKNDTMVYKPDTYFTASDYGICLLGMLAEEVSKTRFAKLMKKMVLDTLGLKETLIDSPYDLIDNRSATYDLNYIAHLTNAPFADLRFCAPAHGFLSTADDLNKAAQAAIIDTTFFQKETRDQFFTRHALEGGFKINRGFGWWIAQDRAGRTLYAQVGSTIGGSSMIIAFPDQKLIVTICANISNDRENLPAEQIADLFLKKIDPRENDQEKKEIKQKKAGQKSKEKVS